MEHVVLQSNKGYFLRFLKTEIPVQKKTSLGVRGMKLGTNAYLEYAYLLESHQEYKILCNEKEYSLNKLKLSKRDNTGTKPRM